MIINPTTPKTPTIARSPHSDRVGNDEGTHYYLITTSRWEKTSSRSSEPSSLRHDTSIL